MAARVPVALGPNPAPDRPSLEFATDLDGDAAVLRVDGDLDLATAPAMHRVLFTLLSFPLRSLTVDMAGVDFMDASGLRALLAAAERANAHGVGFSLRSVSRGPLRVLRLTHCLQALEIQELPPGPAIRGKRCAVRTKAMRTQRPRFERASPL
jgi:anti-sigma B factor antagonist